MPRNRKIRILLILIPINLWLFSSRGWAEDAEPLILTEVSAGRGGKAFESEHRPLPVRKYRLKTSGVSFKDLEAFVRRPNGEILKAGIRKKNGEVQFLFPTPMGDGPMHGIHTLYVIERQVKNRCLEVRIAKWYTIHHSCGWGHGYKYDADRLHPAPLHVIPLEIDCKGLWGGNFHSKVQSGDRLQFTILSEGKPAAGADVRLTSGKGWTKSDLSGSDGSLFFELIRDYYPPLWKTFDRLHKERFIVTAQSVVDADGSYSGADYDRIRYVSSLVWTYLPARSEYSSYTGGLSIAFLSFLAAAGGVYLHRLRHTRPYREVRFREED